MMNRRGFLRFIAIGIGASFVAPQDAARMLVPTGVEMTGADLLRRLPSGTFSGGLLTEVQSERFIDLVLEAERMLVSGEVRWERTEVA